MLQQFLARLGAPVGGVVEDDEGGRLNQLGLVVAPIAGMPVPALDFDHYLDTKAAQKLFDHMRNTVWVNLLSLPAIALPNGIQIVGCRFREDQVFDTAGSVEKVLGPVSIAGPR